MHQPKTDYTVLLSRARCISLPIWYDRDEPSQYNQSSNLCIHRCGCGREQVVRFQQSQDKSYVDLLAQSIILQGRLFQIPGNRMGRVDTNTSGTV